MADQSQNKRVEVFMGEIFKKCKIVKVTKNKALNGRNCALTVFKGAFD